MLEGLAAWVLNTYVGEYVENLNTDQLSIALLQGDVELENLPLKKDALKSLDIPLEVKSGVIGKIILHIPIRVLRSEPWSITIENLFLVAGPLTHLQYDEKTEKLNLEAAKIAMLDALEAKWKILRQGRQEWATSSWFSYGTSMATNILENIQLNVKNVHVRYENETLNPDSPFVFGVVIGDLSVQSTDENGKQQYVNEKSDVMYKLVDLKNLSIYCDSTKTMLGSLPSQQFLETMQGDMSGYTLDSQDRHDYILKPISASAQVKRFKSALPLRSVTTPRISVDFVMEAINFQLTQMQFKCVALWNREFDRHNRRRKYRKNRPKTRIKESPKKWWKFAISCHLSRITEENQRKTWDFVLYRSRVLVDYYDSYLAHLIEGGSNPDNEYRKTKIESELDYEELKNIRELVLSKLQSDSRLASIQSFNSVSSQKSASSMDIDKDESQPGLFQRWFPGWGGWSQTSTEHTDADSQSDIRAETTDQSVSEGIDPNDVSTEIEKEIMDVIHDSTENSSFLRKDTIFAKMKFTLNHGSFQLLENVKCSSEGESCRSVADLQCSTITMAFESRPRTSAMKFSLAVQGLQFEDTFNNFTSFPYLICPQSQESFPRSANSPPIITIHPDKPDPGGATEQPFCQIVFEKNPVTHFHRYRASVRTRAIDIVYNPASLKRIKEFFTLPSSGLSRPDPLSPRSKFGTFRKQTQEELQKTLTQFLESNQGKSKARWDVNLDISAPKFIIPENLSDPNSVMVVLDLGNFKLQTQTSQSTKHTSSSSQKLDEDITEDDFHTPLSTPPNGSEDNIDVKSSNVPSPTSSLSSEALHDHLYERYIIDLTDLQVLQGRGEDNWRYAYAKGMSRMHVIDKFTISLQLERRLVTMCDPQFPNMTICGTLPFLTFHLNETKIMALQNCWETLTTSDNGSLSQIHSNSSFNNLSQNNSEILLDRNSKSEENVIDSRLIVFRFFINKLSLEVQSRGRALVELQVTGVEANLSQKKLNTSLTLTVHSLLIVDALQSFGPDFELLVASHKNLMLDSASGSIRGSHPASPSSPASPQSPNSPVGELTSCLSATSFHTIQDVLAQAFNKVTSASKCSIQSEPSDGNLATDESESGEKKTVALISLELEVIKSEQVDNSIQTDMQILNLQFNSLDLIANQETLVELISFVNRTSTNKGRQPSKTLSILEKKKEETKSVESQLENNFHINADFSRLNILLPHFTEENGRKVGHKISTATMSNAKVEAIFGEYWQIEGALGGLHLSDVTPDGSRYQQVFSIGDCDLSDIPVDMFETAIDNSIFTHHISSRKKACSFSISKSVKKSKHLSESGLKTTDVIYANFEMGSVCYTHCPKFLEKLTNCLSAFHDYMSMVATSIKTAATEVAYGLVGGRGDNLENTGLSFAKRDISLSDMAGILLEDEETLINDEQSTTVIKIMARMETPILVIPRSPNSSHVLLAHLGQMTITNSPTASDFGTSYENLSEPTDKIHISLTNMNLFSADLEKLGILPPQDSKSLNFSGKKSFYSMLSHERGSPIIYNTAVDLVITNDSTEYNYINPNMSDYDVSGLHQNTSANDSIAMTNSVMDVSARIKSPFKLVLSKEVYEQLLETLDNLTYTEDVVISSSSKLNQVNASTSDTDSSSSSSQVPSQHASDLDQIESFMAKHFSFEVPIFEAELRGDFGEGEQGLVNLKLHDFSLKFKKDNTYLTNIEFRLRSLTMEDLLECEDSLHRHIMVSHNSSSTSESKHTYLSTSCPDSTIVTPVPKMPHSLPSSFQDDPILNMFQHVSTTSVKTKKHFGRSQSVKVEMLPCTPPPSPRGSDSTRGDVKQEADDLVHIDLVLVDKKSQQYMDKYDKTNRFIDIKFRCLETTINLQTWVVLLDFLGMGAKISDMSTTDIFNDSSLKKTVEVEEPVNSKVNFSVESFTLVLNKKDYELARANITHLDTHIDLHYGNLEVNGQLGSISLLDNSPSGELYRERFITSGRQALEFDFFKHGSPDYALQREYDIYVKLKMASVRYVHTNRFQSEILAFCQHFLQLQDVLGRMRAASAGKLVTDKAMRGARLKLDIDAGSPILLVPQSTKTKNILVADLGKLRVTNCFKHDGTKGTITHVTLETMDAESPSNQSKTSSTSTPKKDTDQSMTESMFAEYLPKPNVDPMCASIIGSLEQDFREEDELVIGVEGISTINDLPSPDVMSSSVDPPLISASNSLKQSFSSGQNYYSVSEGPSELSPSYQCLLDVWKVSLKDMDLYTSKRVNKKDYKKQELLRDLEFPSYIVQEENGRLLQDKCLLELNIERNLEGDISHTAPDWRMAGKLSSLSCRLDLEQYKLIRGILDHNLGEQVEEFERPLMTHLKDPSIQTVLSGEVYNCINMVVDLHNVTVELLLSHDNGPTSPDVSLAKLDFIRSKLTYESSSNQSKDISLSSHAIVVSDTRYKREPMNARPNVFVNILQPKIDSSLEELQMELHYRSTKESTQFTVLLNKMKVMCIFDWLVGIKEFLLTNPDKPFETEMVSSLLLSPEPCSSRQRGASPLNISQSLATKRGPFTEEVKIPFQGKLNLQDTQLIVVGDTTSLDTSAVILQSTAVIMYKPQATDKVMVCDLQSVEVFSCCLMALEETAQSIIDPLAISIDLNANPPVNLRPVKSAGLLDVTRVLERRLLLQVTFSVLNIRVSYQDLMLFMVIMDSLPQQALQATQSSSSTKLDTSNSSEVLQLMSMGFSKEDCYYAIQNCHGNADKAAIWLTKHTTVKRKLEKNTDFALTAVELKATSMYFCLIDDCGADVPLAEISLNGIDISQNMEPNIEGKAKLNVIGSYYNRNLSGWEPFLESWPCYIEWKSYIEPKEKLAVQVSSPEVLNINLTSTLITQYNETRGTWTEDYSKQNSIDVSKTGSQYFPLQRRRTPFIPYKLINKTGCNLHFTTATTTPTSGQTEASLQLVDDNFFKASKWKIVQPGKEVPFKFSRREKVRHRKTHEMYHNQLLVKVEGWQKPSAVCVDKVGVYFRHVDCDNFSAVKKACFATRIKFEVKQHGSAGKIITVSSALMVENKLDSHVELKLENMDDSGQYECIIIPPDIPTPLPLPCVYNKIWARPSELSLNFSDQPINWQNVTLTREVTDSIKQCYPIHGCGVYRFCVCVRRENYPSNEEVAMELELEPKFVLPLPGHTIMLLPPLVVKSLLPIELHYYLKNTQISGNIKAGKEAAIHAADTTKDFEIGIHLENFETCREVNVPPRPSYNYRVKLRLYDKSDRLLELTMRIQTGRGGSVRVSIAAPYWIVNKSGLPLLFKQEGTKIEAAGQFEEHEIARSVTPLLFSYNEKDEPNLVSLRLGKKHHGDDSLPQWCQKTSLENGSGTRQLHVVPRQMNRPDWVYNIGYQITPGKGKFRDTNVITIAPRYEIDNQSNFKLAIAQKFLITSQILESLFLTALPKCKLPYHWPRMDLDQLLCVRIMDHPSCQWSGGFCVDRSKSFHINMRDGDGRCLLLKVEIILQGPTFVIVLANSETMPPPFRLDNMSPIAVKFFQSEVTDDRLHTFLRPNTSVLYSWDEPILEPVLSLQIPSGITVNYNLNNLGEGQQLNYENYIYLSATHTFNRPISSGRELVLESTNENHLLFKRKEKDKRSQMWRMTSEGMLEHYGSVPPTEPGKSSKSRPRGLVLDILDMAPQPTECIPLFLRKPDKRRKSTQTWKFTEDGRLVSSAGPMCVQVLGGVNLLQDGAIAVLGPSPNFVAKIDGLLVSKCPVPPHMMISRQKLRPGSGCLSVKVVMDGPIRVLKISDRQHTEIVQRDENELGDWEVYDMADRPADQHEDKNGNNKQLEVTMSLKGGLGISLINHIPEELAYIKLSNISLEVTKTNSLTTFETSVASAQVDNQMFGAQRPIVLFVTQTSQRDGLDNTPALFITAHKLPSEKWNAEIYKHLIITTKKLTVQLEEKFLWKLLPFLGYKADGTDIAKVDDNTGQAVPKTTAVQTKRYYFGALKIKTGRVTLSMATASNLSPDLQIIKNSLFMPLIAFEEAKVDLDSFNMSHPFETSDFLFNEIMTHYTEELKGQATKILGSVDFLGNPLGFVNDVTEGLSGLIKDGNVGGLFKNVTHGVSNTAAKMTGALSDGFATVSMDEKHNKTREELRQVESGQSRAHLLAGVKGLGYGIYGGLTGIVTQSYSGAKEKGIQGFLKGAGKGLVGTVTKPVAGVLDFTSGVANAVRDKSQMSSRLHPPRSRDPRVNPGARGVISSYSFSLARAQILLYNLNNNNYSEYVIALEYLGYGENNLISMVSSHYVRILKREAKQSDVIISAKLSDIVKAEYTVMYEDDGVPVKSSNETRKLNERIYLQLTMKTDVNNSRDINVKKPQIRCERINIAKKVCQQINYARNLHDDRTHTLLQTEQDEDY